MKNGSLSSAIIPFRTLSGHTNWVNDLIFTPDGAQLVSAGGDHTIRIWDIASGKQVGNPLTGHDSQVWSLLFDHSRPQLTLVSLGSNGRVLWWDFARRALIAPALETGAESEAMVLSPDGRRLYLGTFGPNAHMWTPPPFHWKKRAHWLANRNLTPDETRHYLVNVP